MGKQRSKSRSPSAQPMPRSPGSPDKGKERSDSIAILMVRLILLSKVASLSACLFVLNSSKTDKPIEPEFFPKISLGIVLDLKTRSLLNVRFVYILNKPSLYFSCVVRKGKLVKREIGF